MTQSNQLTVAAIILAGGLIAAAVLMQGSLSFGGGPGIKTFNVVMENNRYTPSELVANLGDTVVINFENRDAVGHAIEIPEFNAKLPQGHVPANSAATMTFVADKLMSTDAAVCGGANPTDKTDDHGEELIFRVI